MSLFQKIFSAVAIGNYIPPPPGPTPFKLVFIGDSLLDNYGGMPRISTLYFTPEQLAAGCVAVNLAVSGQQIGDQILVWDAYDEKDTVNAAYIQIGINNLNPLSQPNPSAYSSLLQELIDDVRAGIGAEGKIIVGLMTPWHGYMDANMSVGDAALFYQLWLDVNAAYLSETTGVDVYVTENRDTLMEGAGYMKAEYDIGDHLHTNEDGRNAMVIPIRAAINPLFP